MAECSLTSSIIREVMKKWPNPKLEKDLCDFAII